MFFVESFRRPMLKAHCITLWIMLIPEIQNIFSCSIFLQGDNQRSDMDNEISSSNLMFSCFSQHLHEHSSVLGLLSCSKLKCMSFFLKGAAGILIFL